MPVPEEPEIEIVCPRCGHRLVRTPARLRRETKIVCPACGTDVVPPAPDRSQRASSAVNSGRTRIYTGAPSI